MITVEEVKYGQNIRYLKTIDNIHSYIISAEAIHLNKQGKMYYLLYSSNMELNTDVFRYVNLHLYTKSENTKIKALEALKLLINYQQLFNLSLEDFSLSDVDDFRYFLHGYSPQSSSISFINLTVRSNDTVNGYFAVYRGYLNYLGVYEHPMLTKKELTYSYLRKDENAYRTSPGYKTSEGVPNKDLEIPKYISVDEFTNLVRYFRNEKNIAGEIIIRMMFQCGLRIGETLGLTADDLVMEKQSDGKFYPIAYLRNRVSDAKDQNAKTCMKVSDCAQYKTREYQTADYGYQFVVVPPDLYDLINDYIETYHSEARSNTRKTSRYYKRTQADRVRLEEPGEDINYYIFLNSIGTPLRTSDWNKQLRKAFESVGIAVDIKEKKHGLNHRFRHGFAMFNVQYMGVKEVPLANLLRHHGTSSVMCYYRPTISDQIKLKTDFVNSLYDIIPELRR